MNIYTHTYVCVIFFSMEVGRSLLWCSLKIRPIPKGNDVIIELPEDTGMELESLCSGFIGSHLMA